MYTLAPEMKLGPSLLGTLSCPMFGVAEVILSVSILQTIRGGGGREEGGEEEGGQEEER